MNFFLPLLKETPLTDKEKIFVNKVRLAATDLWGPIFKVILCDEKNNAHAHNHSPEWRWWHILWKSKTFVQISVLPTYWKKKEGGLGETLYLSLHSHPLVDCAVVVFLLERHFHLFEDNWMKQERSLDSCLRVCKNVEKSISKKQDIYKW